MGDQPPPYAQPNEKMGGPPGPGESFYSACNILAQAGCDLQDSVEQAFVLSF